jgi:hypothetical protein
MSDPTSLGVEYLSRAELLLQSDLWWDSVLGLAHFGAQPIAISPKPIPVSELTIAPGYRGRRVRGLARRRAQEKWPHRGCAIPRQ